MGLALREVLLSSEMSIAMNIEVASYCCFPTDLGKATLGIVLRHLFGCLLV